MIGIILILENASLPVSEHTQAAALEKAYLNYMDSEVSIKIHQWLCTSPAALLEKDIIQFILSVRLCMCILIY